MSQERILTEVRDERRAQDALWGGPEHDDQHTQADWISLLCRHVGLAVDDGEVDSERFRKQMIRVAALAVAAVEAHDRKTGRGHAAGAVHTTSGV